MEEKIKFDSMAKCLVIGDSGVGKSSMMKQLVSNDYNESPAATLGLEFKFKRLDYTDHQ